MSLPEQQTLVVLFDGSKTFWKTRSDLRILIIKHVPFNCLEIISYDPVDGIEFPRFYLDSTIINSKFNVEAVEKSYTEQKEVSIRQKKITKDKNEMISTIRNQMITQFVLSRVNFNIEKKSNLKIVSLQASFEDVEVHSENGMKKLDFEMIKPNKLIPFHHQAVIVKS